MNIYVGNLSPDVTNDHLQETFGEFGKVATAKVMRDKYSGESRGFGFVEMPDKSEAQAAIDALQGKDLMGRSLKVSEAHPRPDTRRGGGPQGRGGGSYGSGGGGRRRF